MTQFYIVRLGDDGWTRFWQAGPGGHGYWTTNWPLFAYWTSAAAKGVVTRKRLRGARVVTLEEARALPRKVR